MQEATLDNAVDKIGRLIETYSELEPDSLWSAQQITNARRTEPNDRERHNLRSRLYWTNDASLYELVGKTPVIHQGKGNLIFDNLEEAVRQFRATGHYRPSKESAEAFKKADSTLAFKLGDLGLRSRWFDWIYFMSEDGCFLDNPFSYFVINTLKGRKSLNSSQQIFSEIPYGPEEVFDENMKMFSDNGIKNLKVVIFRPAYVKELAADGPIAYIDRVMPFKSDPKYLKSDSAFSAAGYLVDAAQDSLRGLPKKREDTYLAKAINA